MLRGEEGKRGIWCVSFLKFGALGTRVFGLKESHGKQLSGTNQLLSQSL
ncbi:unnamed protein product [Amoebophrya sp. A120]|nr:unnamed protein product [Amoebophrya sp. A120]|eukprot:GSA120T00022843001.1